MSTVHSFARSYVTSIDIGTGKQTGPSDTPPIPMPRRAHVLLRIHDHPIGEMDIPISADTKLATVARAYAWENFKGEIENHLRLDGIEMPKTAAGISKIPATPCHKPLDVAPKNAPYLTVVLPTVDNEESCIRSINRILESKYPNFEVLIVDNTPHPNDLESVVKAQVTDPRVRVVHEQRQGASFARNMGWQQAKGEIVVFADDDVVVEPGWLFAIAQAYVNDPEVGSVTGSIMAAEIETPAQAWLEQYGGYNKGFRTQVYDLKKNRRKTPLYPYDAGRYGSGANMSVRRSVLEEIGGFCVDLGAGTPCFGGEDIDVLRRVISAKYRLVYEPSALLWHFHRRSYSALSKQMFRYGAGLSAMVTKWMMDGPGTAFAILRRLPAGFVHVLSPSSSKNSHKTEYYPRQLTLLEQAGIAAGPFLYFKSKVVVRKRSSAGSKQ